jgi:type VI secretion system protein VasG
MSLDLQSLIAKLDPPCRKGLETAAELCVSQTNYNVEIEHLLLKLLEAPDSDIHRLLKYYDIEVAAVTKELTAAIDRFKRGNSRTPTLSPYILTLCEQAWLVASLQWGADTVTAGAVFKAILDDDNLRGVILESAPVLNRISRDAVKKEFDEIIRASAKAVADTKPEPDGDDAADEPARRPGQPSQTPALDQYTLDLTARARQGKIDPIYGRDPEIRQLIDILTRRRQNNPILTGEAGVGKTAVVEGFAIRIARGNVPPALKNISLRLLDLALLQAGAGIKGEFEKRLKGVIEEVKKAFRPTILFIDEAHTMIGAGGPAGQGDAANLLKPALARGELRTIAATTWSEYKKYFEKDPALVRRFQVVKVAEPEEDAAVEMLRGVVANLEKHHQVTVLDEAVWDAVRLSHRYITGRQLPDKAISVLDTACARVAIGQTGTPPEIEDVANQVEQLELELAILKRENVSGVDHTERIADLTRELEEGTKAGKLLEERWKAELGVVKHALELQERLHQEAAADEADGELAALKAELLEAKGKLEALQGQKPMVPLCVDSGVIARVISNWTGIPVGKMMTNEIDTVLRLKEKMSRRIIGQDQALDAISRRIRTYRADLDDPGKPVGVFLLVGPSGIGKTETALTLAELLYGGERNMVTINMSEYQEAYTVSGLRGAPPGYVGYGKGGVLTEAVHHNPYTAVLLDEVEKAHPDVMELFYQVFDKGIMEDSEGLAVDFKNTVIMLTSNVGTDAILKACAEGEAPPDTETLVELVRPELLKHFKPAFLGRLVIVPYYPLSDDVIRRIVRLKLDLVQQRFTENHRVDFSYSDKLVAAIAARCTEVDTGARNVDHLLTQTLLPEISAELLSRMAAGQICTGIHTDIDEAEGFVYTFEPPVADNSDEPAEPRLSAALGRPIPGRVPAGFQPESIKDLMEPKQADTPKLKKPIRVKKRSGKKSKKWRDLLNRL